MGLFMWDFPHGKYIWMWSDIHYIPSRESWPYTVAMPGVERKRGLECYRSLDKDCSHCQVSRPGQLNTEGDPSTYAHPWDRDLERRDGNRRGCQRVRFKVSSLLRQLLCWKTYKVNNIKLSRHYICIFFCCKIPGSCTVNNDAWSAQNVPLKHSTQQLALWQMKWVCFHKKPNSNKHERNRKEGGCNSFTSGSWRAI